MQEITIITTAPDVLSNKKVKLSYKTSLKDNLTKLIETINLHCASNSFLKNKYKLNLLRAKINIISKQSSKNSVEVDVLNSITDSLILEEKATIKGLLAFGLNLIYMMDLKDDIAQLFWDLILIVSLSNFKDDCYVDSSYIQNFGDSITDFKKYKENILLKNKLNLDIDTQAIELMKI